jgi:hypothetical protein
MKLDCNPHQIGLLLLLGLNALLSACHKPEAHSVPLSGQVCLTTPGGKNIELSHADVRVYDKKTFDTILLDVKTQAEETKNGLLDVALKERDRLQEEVRLCQMDKEQMEKAKTSSYQMLSRNLDAYADELRKDMRSFTKQIDAIEATIEQDQNALNDIASKEREAQRLLSRELLVRNVLNALPKPLQEIKSDAHGNFQMRLKSEADYVVVTNASGEVAGDIEFYRTSIPPPNGEAPRAILLSLYTWNAGAK